MQITNQFHVQKLQNYCFNPLPQMPILGSSNSAANKNMMLKNMDKCGYNYLIE